jgi:protein involved in sex pheromone biosynthesis
MRKVLGMLLVAAVLVLSSCQARVTDTSLGKYESGVQYFQDKKTGEVYALVVIKTGVNAQEDGVGLAHIDRDDVTQKIKAQIKNYKE